MDFINSLIDNNNWPLLTAFLLGVLTSISPCTLATNITAIAYISKEIKTVKHTLFNSLFYTAGRVLSYALLAALIYLGFSVFSISSIFEGWGDKALGLVLITVSLIMFGVIKINIGLNNNKVEKLKTWLAKQGYVGSMLLGMIFALAFCPYSGVLFFGALIPLTFSASTGLLLPIMYALGTGLPVIIFSFLLAFSLNQVGKVFQISQKIEKIMRYLVASVFMLAGLYYTYALVKYLWLIFI